jgi:hypothetical protein
MNTTELVLLFLDFSTISYEFSKLAEFEMQKGTDSLQKGPWKDSNRCNQVPGRCSSREQIDGDQFRRDSSSAARAKGGEMLRSLRRTQGWPELDGGGPVAAARRRTEAAAAAGS